MVLLIKNVQIVDGSGRPAYKADLVAVNGRITGIGNFGEKKADRVVNGLNGFLAPGFIDVNTDADHCLDLFRRPEGDFFLKSGATTILGGLCGSSLAPILRGRLEAVRWWSDSRGINVDWRTMAEFFRALRRLRLGTNFASLVGHYTLRSEIAPDRRRLSREEGAMIDRMLEKALLQGAFGISFGLGFSSESKTSKTEIQTLLKSVSRARGLASVHLRDGNEKLRESIRETGEMAKRTPTIISHFYPTEVNAGKYEKALRLIESYPRLYFDLNLSSEKRHSLHSFLDADFFGLEVGAILNQLADQKVANRLIRKWTGHNYRSMKIVRAPGREYLEGKTLDEFSRGRDLLPKEGLLELMKLTRLKGVIAEERLFPELSRLALKSERALVASNSSSSLESKNSAGVFMEYLSAVSADITLEKAVSKITSLPAKLLGLRDRGLIKEGQTADLVIFNDFKVKDAFISGEQVLAEGQPTDRRAGKILIRHASKKRG